MQFYLNFWFFYFYTFLNKSVRQKIKILNKCSKVFWFRQINKNKQKHCLILNPKRKAMFSQSIKIQNVQEKLTLKLLAAKTWQTSRPPPTKPWPHSPHRTRLQPAKSAAHPTTRVTDLYRDQYPPLQKKKSFKSIFLFPKIF